MIRRFEGESGKRLLIQTLLNQKIISGNHDLATAFADVLKLQSVKSGDPIIEQDASDNDIFLILAGMFEVIVNGRVVAIRTANDHVGEMAAIEPTQRRSASVRAKEESVVARLSEEEFSGFANKYPEIYRCIARELAKRLMQRNSLVNLTRSKIRVFLISSAESLDVARIIQNALAYDDFTVTVWTDGVFKVANYLLESLENEMDNSDFGIAIAHADDITQYRGQEWPAPRDNVLFELGLFMGRLGKKRAILMEPRDQGVKLPSDLTGITTILYRFEKGKDAASLMAPACNLLRDHILSLGPNN